MEGEEEGKGMGIWPPRSFLKVGEYAGRCFLVVFNVNRTSCFVLIAFARNYS